MIYRYTGNTGSNPNLKPSTLKRIDPVPQNPDKRITMNGTFYPDRQLAVCADKTPDDEASLALEYYNVGMAIPYDSYIMANCYTWISYIDGSGNRHYVLLVLMMGESTRLWEKVFIINK